MSEGDASEIDVQASNDPTPQPQPPAPAPPPPPVAPPPPPAATPPPAVSDAEGAGPQEAFAAAGGDGAAIDPGNERELWCGRTSWKHFYGNGVVWGVAVVVLLIAGVWLRSKAAFLQGSGFWWGMATLIILPGAYLFLRCAIQIYGVRYRLTTQRIFVEKGILSRTTDQTELVRVDDVRVKQGIADRIFGCGDVEVMSTDASDASLAMVGVETPDRIAEHVRQHMRILRKKSLFVENL